LGYIRAKGEVSFCRAVFLSTRNGVPKKEAYRSWLSTDRSLLFWSATVLIKRKLLPPSPAYLAARSGVSFIESCFKYKKEKAIKTLISLDPKRQFQTVNRHDRSVKRQNVLALLSFNCHTSVC
jgi:hypothetical protein